MPDDAPTDASAVLPGGLPGGLPGPLAGETPGETSGEMPGEAAAVHVPDSALKSALEFAVGIAAAGAKLRPPLPFPAGLKPYLRFHKLPPAAMAKVRSAVEGDALFLHRLGTVATDELVDEIGLLWLTRPTGWVTTAAQRLAAAAEHGADHGPGELRREQRRREAAEATAARSRLELAGMRDQLD
ncbi:MAG: hypothetical protein Q7V88_16620, partial [Actinomycetota bacterium]|nr:hypothetical protein [Actinomycetota bacterium]